MKSTRYWGVKSVTVMVIGSLVAIVVAGCATAEQKPEPAAPTIDENTRLALANLDLQIQDAKEELKHLPQHLYLQERDMISLVSSMLDMAQIHSNQNDFMGAQKLYTEARANLGSLKKLTPLPNDRDGDGIPDDKDKCPDEPEDYNGFLDEDGCPEDIHYFVIMTTDALGAFVTPSISMAPRNYQITAEPKPYSGTYGLIIPGQYQLTVTSPGYKTVTMPIVISKEEKYFRLSVKLDKQ